MRFQYKTGEGDEEFDASQDSPTDNWYYNMTYVIIAMDGNT